MIPSLEFDVAVGAVKAGAGFVVVPGRRFQFANKARAYTKIKGTGTKKFGGPYWAALKASEAAVNAAAKSAVADWERLHGIAWPKSEDARYSIVLDLIFGDLAVECRSIGRKTFVRRMRGDVRARRSGIDKTSQAILDGLQGAVFLDDEQTFRLSIRKLSATGELGDCARLTIAALE